MPKIPRVLLPLLLFLLLAAVPARGHAFIPQTGMQVKEQTAGTTLPSLENFIGQVRNGTASQVSGLYVADLFAYAVIQQPANQPAFVSQEEGKITQFSLAGAYGSLGFLAHNTLAGAYFSEITLDQVITVVYGDGRTVQYQVTATRRFQATSPNSPYSSFTDLSSKRKLSGTELFKQTYGVKDTLILQTCISSHGIDTWGRLFVIAIPYIPEPANNK